jgi:two-component system, OmpR family, phosphate regulon sensor histidine kinase PhoR
MRRLSRVWKLYIVYTVLLLGALAAGGFLLQSRLHERLVGQCTENTFALARLVGEVIGCPEFHIKNNDLDSLCRPLAGAAGVRISIMDKDGRLIGDSSDKARAGDSRSDRAEIVSAISKGSGRAVRRSTTVGIDMCYVAVKVEDADSIVRVGVPMENVTKLKNEVAILMAFLLYFAPIVIVGAVFFVARKLASVRNR